MNAPAAPAQTISARLSDWAVETRDFSLPAGVADMVGRLMLDVAGLCVAARNEVYVAATIAGTESGGACTTLGHPGERDMYGAALINGTAAHGEDFDDTFEGGPIHSGAVIVPAVLAACERFGSSGEEAIKGIAVGVELMCRLALVAPKAIHKAGFHPTAVIGTIGAAAGVGTALGLDRKELVNAMGIAGSMSSGIIEYLADGSWTKRMHAGWSAQSGIRAAMMAKGGFAGPVSVLEGTHGFFKAFAPSREPNFDALLEDLGSHWYMTTIAFKPYACGTMTQPYVDCAIELAECGVAADDIESIVCEVGEGTVHRLWEPLADKQEPATAYFGKFSSPYCIAIGFHARAAGLAQFTEEAVRNPDVIALAKKVSYVVHPDNPYPSRFTGHLRVTLRDGQILEIRRDNMRGGAHQPLAQAEFEEKYRANLAYGGWSEERCAELKAFVEDLNDAPDLSGLGSFRG